MLRRIALSTVILCELLLGGWIVSRVHESIGKKSGAVLPLIRLEKARYLVQTLGQVSNFYEPLPFADYVQPAESWMTESVPYSINADGLNERYSYDIQHASQTYRIISLGDSFTFGLYVPTYANWSERLEDTLQKRPPCSRANAEVINLGVPGYDIEFSALRYKKRGAKYHPDLVLWYIQGNDFVERAGFIFSENPKIVSALEAKGLRGTRLLYEAVSQMQQEMQQIYGSDEEVTRYQLERLTSAMASLEGTTVVLMTDPRIDDDLYSVLADSIKPYAHVVLVRLAPFDTLPDTHPSIRGHQQIARQMAQYLYDSAESFCDTNNGSL